MPPLSSTVSLSMSGVTTSEYGDRTGEELLEMEVAKKVTPGGGPQMHAHTHTAQTMCLL